MRIFYLPLILLFSFNVAANKPSAISPVVTNLPTGPGTISGLGQSISAIKSIGATTLNLPIDVPPGLNGFSPAINLAYSSNLGNGILGMGFDLSIPSIRRQTDKGLPEYNDLIDTFIDENGIELVHIGQGIYRAQYSENMNRYKKNGNEWHVTLPSGIQYVLGDSNESRIQGGNKIFEWKLVRQTDANGNSIEYSYKKLDSTNQIYLDEIIYAKTTSEFKQSVKFDYEVRHDALIDYKPTFELKTEYRLSKITTYSLSTKVRIYKLDYHLESDFDNLSKLQSMTVLNSDESQVLLTKDFKFTGYGKHSQQIESIPSARYMAYGTADVDFIDANNDGLVDVLNTATKRNQIWINKGINLDGIVEFDSPTIMNVNSYNKLSNKNVSWSDFDGDGKSNLVSYNKNFTAYFHLDENLNWKNTGIIKDINFPLDNANVKLFDINNDKRTDVIYMATKSSGEVYAHVVQLNLESGWQAPIIMNFPPQMKGIRFSDSNIRLSDMNGDGLQDVVVLRNKSIAYFPGRGLNGFGNVVLYSNSPRDLWDLNNVKLADMNNDGISDLVNVNGVKAYVWINKGLKAHKTQESQFSSTPTIINAPSNLSVKSSALVDINGNGSTDILWYSPGEYEDTFTFAELFPNDQPNLLKELSNGIGSKTVFTYDSLIHERIRDENEGKNWIDSVPVAMPVLKEVAIYDGVSKEPSKRHYHYHNGFFSFLDREFRGFSNVDEKIYGENITDSFNTKIEYELGKTNEALKGVIKSEEVLNFDGDSYYKDTNTWTVRELASGINDSRTVYMPILDESIRVITEAGSGTPVTLKWQYEYDDYGNVIVSKELGRQDSTWVDERITYTKFSAQNTVSLNNWMLNYPIESTVENASGMIKSKTQWFYDDETFSYSNFGEVVEGNLTAKLAWVNPADNTSQVNTIRKRYNPNGTVSQLLYPLWGEGSAGHSRLITYDNTLGVFPIAEIVNTGSGILTARSTYNFDYGTLSEFIGFNNEVTRYEYDDFGRVAKIAYPGDTLASPSFLYHYNNHIVIGDTIINWIDTQQKVNKNGRVVDSRRFIDGLGRTLLEKHQGNNSSEYIVENQVSYNKRGNQVKSYLPYYSNSYDFNVDEKGHNYLETEFDALNRSTIEWSPYDKNGTRSFSKTEYLALTQRFFDQEQTNSNSSVYGNYKQLYFDGLLSNSAVGRLVKVDEIVQLDEAGEQSGELIASTQYQYDALNNLVALIDAQSNKRTMFYDGLGRNYFYNDPNRGYFWQAFDAANNVIATRDATGNEIYYTYDGANRLTYEYTAKPIETNAQIESMWLPNTDTSNLQPSIAYEYDKVAGVTFGSSLGRLVKVVDTSGYSLYKYDERGRVIEQSRQIQGHGIHSPLYVSQRSYDNANRITHYKYPDETQVEYIYNNRGLLDSIPGVINHISYDAAGNHVQRQYANGVTTDYQYDHLMRLSQLETTRDSDGLQLQKLIYEFDNLVNIKSIVDERSGNTLTSIALEAGMPNNKAALLNNTMSYTYDDFYRLNGASSTIVGYQYRYDLIGNLLNKQKIDPGGNQSNSQFRYGNSQTVDNNGSWNRQGRMQDEVAGPHAMTFSNGQSAYFYDGNGNLLQDGNFIYQWDHRNRLKQVTSSVLTAPVGQAQ